MADLRPGLPPLPDRMRSLPLDHRGYPVPFFVAWVDGKPDFRVADGAKRRDCVRFHLCWLCGQTLGRHMAFVIGPMCAVNRVSAEPPSHRDCAEFAAKACPFLAMPKMERREGGIPDGVKDPAGVMIRRNPGVILVWVTRGYEIFNAGNGQLIRIGDPTETLWFAEGRPATRAEVEASIQTGLPALEAACAGDEEQLAALRAATETARTLLPAGVR